MNISTIVRSIPVFGLGLAVLCTTVQADLVWENQAINNQVINDGDSFSLPGNTVTINTSVFSDSDGGTFDLGFGADPGFFYANTVGLQGNHTGYLAMRFDNQNNDPVDFLSLSMTFDDPVTNLNFSLLDLDAGGSGVSWDDGVEVFFDGVNVKSLPGTFTIGSVVFLDNETFMDGFEGGTTSASGTETSGNVEFDMGTQVVRTIQIRYFSTDDAQSNPSAQILGISDLSFTSIPEPATWNWLLIAGFLAIQRQRRTQRS